MKKKQELPKLPTLGCDLCKEAGWAEGWILEVANGMRLVKPCLCRKRRDAAKRGVVSQTVHDGKAAGAGA